MPRTTDHYGLSGHVWHLVHHCRHHSALLKYRRNRLLWQRWLYEARRHLDLRVLNYTAAQDHIQLLVHDRGEGEIDRAVQLVAGRVAQVINGRHRRDGAFWEDRYHATAVENDEQLRRCLMSIDMSAVCAGHTPHPLHWDAGGYQELHRSAPRYHIIDVATLARALDVADPSILRARHRLWVRDALRKPRVYAGRTLPENVRRSRARRRSVTHFRTAQAALARQRWLEAANAGHCLREEPLAYTVLFDEEDDLPPD